MRSFMWQGQLCGNRCHVPEGKDDLSFEDNHKLNQCLGTLSEMSVEQIQKKYGIIKWNAANLLRQRAEDLKSFGFTEALKRAQARCCDHKDFWFMWCFSWIAWGSMRAQWKRPTFVAGFFVNVSPSLCVAWMSFHCPYGNLHTGERIQIQQQASEREKWEAIPWCKVKYEHDGPGPCKPQGELMKHWHANTWRPLEKPHCAQKKDPKVWTRTGSSFENASAWFRGHITWCFCYALGVRC